MRCPIVFLLFLICSTGLAEQSTISPPTADWFPVVPALPPAKGEVIRVTTVEELFRAAETVKPGGTIVIADGHYYMPRFFDIRTDNVTLRGESGRREKAVLDGVRSRHGELVGITGCKGVTIADLTIQNIKWNGFKINSDKFTTEVTIHNCIVHNIWQRGVKGPKVREEDRDRFRPSDCKIQYCLFYNDRAKRPTDDPDDARHGFGGNYIGGIDVMFARRWTINDNVFVGIKGKTGEARGAIFLWQGIDDCVIERNIIIDCDTGICLGNSHKPADIDVHCTGCVVRNNFVTRCSETGILADYTADCRIVHNTIHDPDSRLRRLIRLVHDNERLVVANNLLSGPPMRVETKSRVRSALNVTRANLSDQFVDAAGGDLHLTGPLEGVTNEGAIGLDVETDIDRDRRGTAPDIGADEVALDE